MSRYLLCFQIVQNLNSFLLSGVESFQNTTIEERVAALEIQLVVIQDDLIEMEDDFNDLEVDLTELEGDVDFLFDEQVIQDERLFSLEQENDVIDTRLLIIDNNLEGELIKWKKRPK